MKLYGSRKGTLSTVANRQSSAGLKKSSRRENEAF